jgi:hypothetical protein
MLRCTIKKREVFTIKIDNQGGVLENMERKETWEGITKFENDRGEAVLVVLGSELPLLLSDSMRGDVIAWQQQKS